MERRAKVELFKHIRREYVFGVGTVKRVAAKLGGASADGAPGVGKCGTAAAQNASVRAAGNRAAAAVHRRHPCAAQRPPAPDPKPDRFSTALRS
jgi:hypothetical protein